MFRRLPGDCQQQEIHRGGDWYAGGIEQSEYEDAPRAVSFQDVCNVMEQYLCYRAPETPAARSPALDRPSRQSEVFRRVEQVAIVGPNLAFLRIHCRCQMDRIARP